MATAKKSNKASKAVKTAKKSTQAAPKKTAGNRKATKKPSAKKAPAKRAPTKKAAAKKAAAKKASTKKVSTKAAPSKASAKKAAPRGRAAPAAKASAKPTKKKAKSPFGAKFVGEMKGRLLAERAKYLHSAEEYRAEADALIDAREAGDVQFDEEGGEGDTLAVERERDLALSNQSRQAVDQIDAALERITNGTYGLCVASGLAIPQERLRAIPWAAQRVEYKAGGLGRV